MVVISFVNMKGGVGKTTLAVNMADFLTKRHSRRVLLIDVDPQFNATQCLINGDDYMSYIRQGGTTIVDIFNYKKTATVSVVDGTSEKEPVPYDNIRPYTTQRGFDLIPSQLDLFRFEMTPGQGTENRLKNYLNHIKKTGEYDICIIDCPPTPSVWMTSALLASDYYLIPSKSDPISMTGLELLEGIIKERKENYGCACKCAGLVLTMVETNTIVYREAFTYFSRTPRWKPYLYEPVVLKRTNIAKGQLDGTFIIDIDDSDLSRQFSGVTQEFLKRVEGK
ncbi:MAG TPA: ParA family protein [Clostridia bacterium]|nr:ParA family protein [Clostridia bacterium]